MKFTVVVLLLCVLGCTQAIPKTSAAPPSGDQPLGAATPAQTFNLALQKEVQELIQKPEMPHDLVQRLITIMNTGQQGYINCSATVAPWLQERCSAIQLKLTKSQLKAIEHEAKIRTQTANMAALLQSAALVTAAPIGAGTINFGQWTDQQLYQRM